jgi:transketolase
MRKEFAAVMEKELSDNPTSVLLLGDIGVFGHRESFKKFPDRVFNIGILEQSMVSVAAGMAIGGLTPTVHTIAPFLVERAFEQIKIDFGYQSLGGNIVTVGASIDYAALGATHHCPGDIGMMLNIPGTEVYVPGTAKEFSDQYHQYCRNERLSYFRLSEKSNKNPVETAFQNGKLIKHGEKLTIIAIGPMLDTVLEGVGDLDVTILYYNCIWPFDANLLCKNIDSGKVLVVEPFYENTMASVIQRSLSDKRIMAFYKGIPRKFITKYGKIEDHYGEFGLTSHGIRIEAVRMINA